jgi:hypothetical protein
MYVKHVLGNVHGNVVIVDCVQMTRTILKCRGEHLDWILYFAMLKQTNIRSLYVSPGDVIIKNLFPNSDTSRNCNISRTDIDDM